MATRASIKADLNAANKKATQLEEIADDLRSLANPGISGSMESLKGNWEGTNATNFISKGEALKDEVVAQARNLDTIASTIRRVAQNIYDAELKNIERAERRTYNA